MLGDDIARLVLDKFDALPRKQKPQRRATGAQEWIPLGGIVLEKGTVIFRSLMHSSFVI